MNILYAKKFRFPDDSANMIQGLHMVEAFERCGLSTSAFFSFDRELSDPILFLQEKYGINPYYFKGKNFASQKMRGAHYLMWLLHNIFTLEKPIIYTREGTEARRLGLLRHLHFPTLPLFHEVHKYNIDFTSNSTEEKTKIKSLARLFTQVSGLIFIDEALQFQAQKYLHLTVPSCVAPSGVNLSCFEGRPLAPHSPDIVIGYFGKIVAQKGINLLLESFRLLPACYHLRLIGKVEEKERNHLLSLAGEAASRIHFIGHVDHAHLADAMKGVHISVIPSISKTQFLSPLKLAESLAMGLPIVCTPLPHIERLLEEGKHALFSPDVSPQGLAASIIKLGSSPEKLTLMSHENRSYAHAFSWEARARRIIRFMEETQESRNS